MKISKRIKDSLAYIVDISCKNKKNHSFLAFSEVLRKFKKNIKNKDHASKIKEMIAEYGTSFEKLNEKGKNKMVIKAKDIPLNIYTSIYEKEGERKI